MTSPIAGSVLAVFSADEAAALDRPRDAFAALAAAGVDTVVVEAFPVDRRLVSAAQGVGLTFWAGLTCFRDDDGSLWAEAPQSRPRHADGRPAEPVEWYRGLTPTNAARRRVLLDRVRLVHQTPGVAGLILDFCRWPGHWELAERPGVEPDPALFDDSAVAAFQAAHRDLAGLSPDAVRQAAVGAERARWADFASAAVTEFVAEVRRLTPGRGLGVFVVPVGDQARRERYGQDTAALSAHVDLLLPMTYHAILHRPPTWVAEVTAEVVRGSRVPVVPVLQVTADRGASGGWDWGRDFDVSEVTQARAGLPADTPVALFPGSLAAPALDRDISETDRAGLSLRA